MARTWTQRWFGRRVSGTWTLEKDQTTHLPGARGPVAIQVQRGLLLVTREGDPEDHVLAAGEEVIFPGRGRIAAWALEPVVAAVRCTRLADAGARACPRLSARS
jgi:Protein of unknown function (DUF2917)